MADDRLLRLLQREARPLRDLCHVEPLLARVANAHTVLLGEASHGTHEFYALRAEVTRRLIAEHGFDAVAVESDWPDALRVNRFVRGSETIADADDALAGYERFPRWMWRNEEVRAFVDWLRAHNDRLPAERRAGFYGLDLYSLRASMEAVVRYLDRVDPEAADRARTRYACFDHLADEPQQYGHAVRFGLTEGCERAVLQQLHELIRRGAQALHDDADELFFARQNANVVRNAERYYRAMFGSHTESWNLRDRHMAQTLSELRDHLSGLRGRRAKLIVWAHNSHIGDARATEPGDQGQLTLGQLVRESSGEAGASVLVGFTTHTGTVAAASDWDEPVELKTVLPSRPDSIEHLLHSTGMPLFMLSLDDDVAAPLALPRLERAIGVIYRPETERWSHYFHAELSRQFDLVVHIDRTRALTPLDPPDAWTRHEEPETYPSGV